jgi:hypothetical protein
MAKDPQRQEHDGGPIVSRSETTGLPLVNLGTIITTEDVQALEDDIP